MFARKNRIDAAAIQSSREYMKHRSLVTFTFSNGCVVKGSRFSSSTIISLWGEHGSANFKSVAEDIAWLKKLPLSFCERYFYCWRVGSAFRALTKKGHTTANFERIEKAPIDCDLIKVTFHLSELYLELNRREPVYEQWCDVVDEPIVWRGLNLGERKWVSVGDFGKRQFKLCPESSMIGNTCK